MTVYSWQYKVCLSIIAIGLAWIIWCFVSSMIRMDAQFNKALNNIQQYENERNAAAGIVFE